MYRHGNKEETEEPGDERAVGYTEALGLSAGQRLSVYCAKEPTTQNQTINWDVTTVTQEALEMCVSLGHRNIALPLCDITIPEQRNVAWCVSVLTAIDRMPCGSFEDIMITTTGPGEDAMFLKALQQIQEMQHLNTMSTINTAAMMGNLMPLGALVTTITQDWILRVNQYKQYLAEITTKTAQSIVTEPYNTKIPKWQDVQSEYVAANEYVELKDQVKS